MGHILGDSIPLSVCFGLTIVSNLVVYQISLTFLVFGVRDNVHPHQSFHSWDNVQSITTHGDEGIHNYHLAYNHSFGFFDNIPHHKWIQDYRQPVLEKLAAVSRHSPINDSSSFDDVSKWLYENMDPLFVCPHVRKVGNPAGKWMCDPERWVRVFARRQTTPHDKSDPHTNSRSLLSSLNNNGELPCLVYSIGSKGNFRWEEEFVKIIGDQWCEIHIFDPSPTHESATELQQHPNWHYHAWGLRGTQSTKNYTRRRDSFFDFVTIRKKLGHENRVIDILKMDCEGCEWESMPDWLFSDQYPASYRFPDLRHILLETHSLPHPTDIRAAGNFGRLLPMPEVAFLEEAFAQRRYVLYAKEVNTHQGLGRSVEWGFIRLHKEFFGDQF